jgi:hypothetical protein
MKTLPLLATLLLTPLAALCAAEPGARAAMNPVPLAWPEVSRPRDQAVDVVVVARQRRDQG